ncbi:RNA-dependent RNA polymerase, eukaryotic-type [Dillenia turbinata]|uniref:RNA-dependent RNA polymerase n=1 Tax=Dillenia turbinata TaxID=194707 RepID=A0AAN8YWS5_9MAGN
MVVARKTVRVSNISQTATAIDLLTYLESILGHGSVYAIQITTAHKNWKSKGFGKVQFETLESKCRATLLSRENRLVFRNQNLLISNSFDDLVVRPIEPKNSVDGGTLHVGFMADDETLCGLERWAGVKLRVMPERKRIEFWLDKGLESYKMEFQFGDVLETCKCCLDGEKPNAVLLKLKYGPKIYHKVYGPNVASSVGNDRYYICKENFEFIWVRTTDFSSTKSIGKSSTFSWKVEGLPDLDIFTSFPFLKEELINLIIEEAEDNCAESGLVPLVKCGQDSKLAYEILFQLNSLVQTHKISLAAVDNELIDTLASLTVDTAMIVLQKLQKRDSICYDPTSFIKTQLHVLRSKYKHLPSTAHSWLTNHNIMSCHRVLITPSKIYCLGPELESSNYVVKHFALFAADFVRVTFVEEDWSKLPPNALSANIEQGIFANPLRTDIYHRILSVLREGIVIGSKRFEFLAFSASQLRSNSVWMFASNSTVKVEDIRAWMGCFNKIRSISKCAARMGQLFSSSKQTLIVPAQDVEIIPDVEVTTNGISYCFSDGIGKISLSFAKQVAQKLGLSRVPSAFQIRYGGYKGVIAVDRNSFRKLSFRNSMCKFESNNRMLNVTKCSESMPCYLNREIVTLLSTLGVKDEVFEALQQEQLNLLDKMLKKRGAALDVLEGISGVDSSKSIVAKMLLQGYEPNAEPYLSMMMSALHDAQLSDLRTRCRVFVPKGRILIGCLDEMNILEYGQVYVRVTMTKAELQSGDLSCFRKVDETTAIVVGKVIVTKNPCLHPGDVRVLEAVYEVSLEDKGLVDCLVFPQKGERPHPNECSGGDLDGDQFFICWDEGLIPPQTETPMDYTGRRPRKMDHDVTLEEIHEFFVDYMINDTLGAISTAHLVLADREPSKACSPKCLQLAALHSMAVDFAKTGAPAEMPLTLRPKEYPDFMERGDRPMYISLSVLGKLYRATVSSKVQENLNIVWTEEVLEATFDHDFKVDGFEAFLGIAETHKEIYVEKITALMKYYEAHTEDEILTGNLRKKSMYLLHDNRRFGETKDRILVAIRNLHKEAKDWFMSSCKLQDHQKLASAWYYVTYHPSHRGEGINFLSFPWIVGDVLLTIKSLNNSCRARERGTSRSFCTGNF